MLKQISNSYISVYLIRYYLKLIKAKSLQNIQYNEKNYNFIRLAAFEYSKYVEQERFKFSLLFKGLALSWNGLASAENVCPATK